MELLTRLARSCTRILLAVVLIGGAGAAALAAALRQPTLTALPFRGTHRARPELLRRHVLFLTTNAGPRNAAHPESLARAAAYLADRFREAKGRTSIQRYHARGREYANVITTFGPDPAGEPLLIVGAHYDAFGETGALPGADDNASGTAGLLELARLLGSASLTRPVVLVAFATEEPPFFGSESMGSAVHADSLARQGRAVRGMICLEMIGYFSARQTWPNALFALLYPARGDFIGVAGGWDDRHLTRTVKRAIAGAGGIPVVSFSGPRLTSDASDHRNYWRNGWPAVVVTDTAFLRNPNYHTRFDTAETLDYARMARVVDGVANAVLYIEAACRSTLIQAGSAHLTRQATSTSAARRLPGREARHAAPPRGRDESPAERRYGSGCLRTKLRPEASRAVVELLPSPYPYPSILPRNHARQSRNPGHPRGTTIRCGVRRQSPPLSNSYVRALRLPNQKAEAMASALHSAPYPPP